VISHCDEPSSAGTSLCSNRKTEMLIFSHVCKIVRSKYYIYHVCPSTWNDWIPTGWIFMEFEIWGFFENLSKFNFYYSLTRIIGALPEDLSTYFTGRPMYILYLKTYVDTLPEDLCRLMVIPAFFLEREMFQTKFAEKLKTHILCSIIFPLPPTVFHSWDDVSVVEPDWP
jgi:hypothetical protein